MPIFAQPFRNLPRLGNYMERITLFIRTTKTEGSIKLRFRLIDGRAVDLYHKSDIKADLKDLSKFEADGSVRGRVTIFNKQLKLDIDREMAAMANAYHKLCEKMTPTHISAELFESAVAIELDPEALKEERQKMKILDRFDQFIEEAHRDGIFGDVRKKHYIVTRDSFERFLQIKNLMSLTPSEFTADMLMDLREFFTNEYKYVKKYAFLYKGMKKINIPQEKRENNTVVTRMKKLQTFFNELEDREEVLVSPFRRLGKKRKEQILKEQYDDPRFLHKDEFLKIMDAQVPKDLQQTKDVFLLHCTFGCRVGDFRNLSMDKIEVSEDGIPFVHYLPQKTVRTNTGREEIETPIMRFALDIIKKYDFNFPVLKYVSGKSGYNVKIKRLLKHCNIDRKVKVFNSDKNDNEYLPLYEFGSSKLCRSTHVDMMRKVQVDLYASGLHKEGSRAVNRYTKEELRDRFALMCVAFAQPQYKVDRELNIIGE